MSGAVSGRGKELEFRGAGAQRREGLGRGSDTRQHAHAELERAPDHVAVAVGRDHQASAGGVHPIYFGRAQHRAGADQAGRAMRAAPAA